MRRSGNVLATSPLRSESALLRYTAGATFSDFEDTPALHVGIASAF